MASTIQGKWSRPGLKGAMRLQEVLAFYKEARTFFFNRIVKFRILVVQ